MKRIKNGRNGIMEAQRTVRLYEMMDERNNGQDKTARRSSKIDR